MNKKLHAKTIEYLEKNVGYKGEVCIQRISEHCVYFLVPFDHSAFSVVFESESHEDQIDQFINSVNNRLNTMVEHIEDCMLFKIIK